MRSCGSDNVHMRQRRPLRAGFVAGVCTAVAAEGGRARRAGTLARWGCRPIVRAGLRARRLGGRASPDGPLSSSRGSVPWRPQKSENLAWIWSWSTRVTRSVVASPPRASGSAGRSTGVRTFWYKWAPEARHTCRTCRRSRQTAFLFGIIYAVRGALPLGATAEPSTLSGRREESGKCARWEG